MKPERAVIVNADDFGYSRGVNRGIIEAHERGIVTSTSFMVRWRGAEEAAEYARANPRLGVGLHLDFGEWVYRGGHWHARYLVVPQDAKFDRTGDEVRRQLDAFHALIGREPTHLDSHQHFHRQEPLRSTLLRIAGELALPVRECTPAVAHCGYFYGQSARGHSYPELVSAASLQRTLRALGPGITELACHPAAGLDFESAYFRERLHEHAALCDEAVRETVVAEKVKLISFNDLTADQRRISLPD